MLPLDLFDFEPRFATALRRAFGGHVLAADRAAADTLAQRQGLSAVTPDGTVSHRWVRVRARDWALFGRSCGLKVWVCLGGV